MFTHPSNRSSSPKSNSARTGPVSTTAALFQMAPNPRAVAASTTV